MNRLFIAIPLPDTARAAIRAGLERALPQGLPGRPVRPESWHFTLRFLGDTPPDAAARVTHELAGAALGPPFPIVFGRCGAFPRPSRAEVLWLGVRSGAAELAGVAEVVEGCARRAGFPAERRPFAAHLTLSRLRPAADVRPLLDGVPELGGAMEAREVVVYRSVLGAGPARYEPLARYPLGGAAP